MKDSSDMERGEKSAKGMF